MKSHLLLFATLASSLICNLAVAEVSSPIQVRVAVGPELVVPGDIAEAELEIENTTQSATLQVQFEGIVTYADGTTDQLSRVKRNGGFTIEPGQGIILSWLFLIPEDAEDGTATFTGIAKVTRISGGARRGKYSQPIRASAVAEFEVIEPD